MFIRVDLVRKGPMFLTLLCLGLLMGCAGLQKQVPDPVPEIMPGILTGYLSEDAQLNSLKIVPPPPAEGSAALALDEEISRKGLALRDTLRWDMATKDAEVLFPGTAGTFECALGIPVTESDTPFLYMLLRRTLADAGLSSSAAKKKYKRPRPFMVNQQPTCTPDDEDYLKKDGSYPSGHTTYGWAWALILAEIAPDRAEAILARGRAYGESRIICNAHWNSDVAEGRTMGAAVVARLHTDQKFLADLEMAKKEYSQARAKGLQPSGDCQAEADALAGGSLR
ncbi:Acid phosphatase [Desulfosarcina cetonica]|nr:Acid phosphatase [Desulfosarcina cetonica]